MFGLSFNPMESKTVLAGLFAALTVLYNSYATTGAVSVSAIGMAIAAFFGAIAVKDAIVKSGPTP